MSDTAENDLADICLDDLQSRFQGFLVDGCDNPNDPLPGLVSGTSKAGAGELMAVYFNAYRLRLIEALGEDYQALRVFLGDDGFETMALGYVDQYPSRHYSIRWFGRHLVTFLEAHPPFCDENVLCELAAWEWALSEAFDAGDTDTVGLEEMAAVPPENWDSLTFSFLPSLRRLDLEWSAPAYRAAVEAGEDSPEAPLRGEAKVPWVIWRHGLDTLYRSMQADEARALDLACGGGSFGAVCADLAQSGHAEDAPMRAATFLRTWIEGGLISGLATS